MIQFVMTQSVNARIATDTAAAKVATQLIAHLGRGVNREVPLWRTSYPMDDPTYEPDLWIADKETTKGLLDVRMWAKMDTHEPGVFRDGDFVDPGPGERCEWCGKAHTDPLSIVTFLDPDEHEY
jgi:hypothetical protein